MDTVLSILSGLCFAWVLVYLAYSFRSAIWTGARHSGGFVVLELQPHRARGSREAARARLLKRMAISAVLALPLGIALSIVRLAIL
ncbi:hypothetical protein [Paraburkholderia phenazinium]|jgi:hypothetical protein|uniref:Uncharacterized protein n=1 Tax=Paraburkholderia phenazinium TaxID=60549 RepID=A0A1G7S5C9_9BURK|nr:hypothetical protein [Paraburkholderia phenazinium]SDG18235.1 hypothetical protein SAMN05216466_102390 [Paraburkholderia phenazinium]